MLLLECNNTEQKFVSDSRMSVLEVVKSSGSLSLTLTEDLGCEEAWKCSVCPSE